MKRIGIDVGGTNTDAVLIENEKVVAAVKTATTDDVTGGIQTALGKLIETLEATPEQLDAVMIGTTHFTNAVVQRRDLQKIAAVRIGLPASASLPPLVDWPQDLADIVRGGIYMVEGGHEYDGRPIVPFNERQMREVAKQIRDSGVTSVGVSSIFSPLTPQCEQTAAAILRAECPDIDITLSHDLGRIGLLERENATLLNACIIELARKTTQAFRRALQAGGIDAPLYLTQNDGTVMSAEFAQSFPVYSFASGPTNSMRGAAFLSNYQDAIVVDVGGTTTDIGCLQHGFPREANNVVEIGGVRTLFRMPDLLSLGLGGGTIIGSEPLSVGPRSVGYRLTQEARVFGGATLTATDVAVAAGLIELGDRRAVASLDRSWVEDCCRRFREMVFEGVDRIKTDASEIPLIAVGGGAFLVPQTLEGISEVVHVEHQAVANAVGAAIAQISGEIDQIFSGLSRDQALAEATRLAEQRAVDAGADAATLSVVEIEDLPLSYLPGDARRVRVRVVGDSGDRAQVADHS